MAVSDYDFNVTRNEIIQRALRLVGALSLGESVSADQYTQSAQALNSLVKFLQSEDIFLWTVRETTQALSNGTASYSLSSNDPAVIGIDKAYLRINNFDDPVEVISYQDYNEIRDKTADGDPTCVALNGRITPTLYVWPVPTQSRTLFYTAVVKLKDFDTAAGNPDFPVHYIEVLVYGLASRLADELGLPISERDRFTAQFEQMFRRAQKGDRTYQDNRSTRSSY
jgi:hypothetical protein